MKKYIFLLLANFLFGFLNSYAYKSYNINVTDDMGNTITVYYDGTTTDDLGNTIYLIYDENEDYNWSYISYIDLKNFNADGSYTIPDLTGKTYWHFSGELHSMCISSKYLTEVTIPKIYQQFFYGKIFNCPNLRRIHIDDYYYPYLYFEDDNGDVIHEWQLVQTFPFTSIIYTKYESRLLNGLKYRYTVYAEGSLKLYDGIYYQLGTNTASIADINDISDNNLLLSDRVRINGTSYVVTSINDLAFRDSHINELYIPESITSIGKYAFYRCYNLSSVTIPSSVTSIGDCAFAGCTNLTTVKVEVTDMATFCNNQVIGQIKSVINKPVTLIDGDGNEITEYVIPEGVETIGANAFNNCTGLTSVTIPSSVKSFGANAFEGCSGLTSIAFSDGLTSIGEKAFFGCTGLASITELTIPSSVTSIGSQAFDSFTSLASVKVPVTDMAAFCTNQVIGQIKSVINKPVTLIDSEGNEITEYVIPEGVETIGANAFNNCTGLTSLTIPPSVKSFGANAFEGCSGLTSIAFSDGLTSIGEKAFFGCTGLASITELTIPSSVTSIGSQAFDSFTSLASVKVPVTDMAAFCTNQVIGQIKSVINKPVTLIDGDGNEITEYVIPEGVETIGANAFNNCTGLTSVTISSSVTSIGQDAFFGCASLTTIKVPVADMATFCNNQVISQIKSVIDKPVTLIDGEGNEMTEYVIPEGVETIGADAFNNCTGLTSVTIPSSMTSIGEQAFANCDGLTAVKVDAEECTISDGTFSTTAYDNAILYVPAGRLAWYQEATGWKNFKDIREADRVFMDDVTTVNGVRLPLSIQMGNSETAAGFQFVLNLPEDVTVVESNGSPMITLGERSSSLELMVTKLSAQRYLIAALSMGYEEIEGTEGTIVDVTLSIPRVVRAGEYAVTLKDITISTADGHSLSPADYTMTMTVEENTFGDVNNDGVVNVTDALAIVNHVLNKPVRVFIEANADINQDGNINFTDALNLMRMILSGTASGAAPALFDTDQEEVTAPETQEVEPM